MSSPTDLFIFAGEASGDLHGQLFLKEWHKRHPNSIVAGVAGPRMRQEGINQIMPMESFQVMGWVEIASSLPKLVRQFYHIRDTILKLNPKATILIDYPGFNLRMARALRKKGYQGQIIQFICPSVWAWGKQRIKQMIDTLDLLITILPFEAAIFAKSKLPVAYIGHPVASSVANYPYRSDWTAESNLDAARPILGIFPGSRRGELTHNLPNQLEAAADFQMRNPNYQLAISCAHDDYMPLLKAILEKSKVKASIVPPHLSYELMKASHVAIATSGTVTLELALHKVPTLVTYYVSLLNRIAARVIFNIKLTHFCLVNILKGQEVFPELIRQSYSLPAARQALDQLAMNNSPSRKACIRECEEIYAELLSENPPKKAVMAVEASGQKSGQWTEMDQIGPNWTKLDTGHSL